MFLQIRGDGSYFIPPVFLTIVGILQAAAFGGFFFAGWNAQTSMAGVVLVALAIVLLLGGLAAYAISEDPPSSVMLVFLGLLPVTANLVVSLAALQASRGDSSVIASTVVVTFLAVSLAAAYGGARMNYVAEKDTGDTSRPVIVAFIFFLLFSLFTPASVLLSFSREAEIWWAYPAVLGLQILFTGILGFDFKKSESKLKPV